MAKDPAAPPFATRDGKPITPASGGSGAFDFLADKDASGIPHTKGLDFTTANRPQVKKADPPGLPDRASVPAGGKIIHADPKPVAQKASGPAPTIGSIPKPFKNLKG